MKQEVIIIIPAYKSEPSEQEKFNLSNNVVKLADYDICFVCPHGLITTFYEKNYPTVQITRFNTAFFEGIQGYNKLMLSVEFYEVFSEYQYICICQMDALILKSGYCLDEFLNQGYDYYGAPWFPAHRIYPFSDKLSLKARFNLFFVRKEVQVGNGGLSLRKVHSVLETLEKNENILNRWKIYEDYFFSYIGKYVDNNFKVAPVDVAKRFALETDSKRIIFEEKLIPVGLHAPYKWFPEIYTFDVDKFIKDMECEK